MEPITRWNFIQNQRCQTRNKLGWDAGECTYASIYWKLLNKHKSLEISVAVLQNFQDETKHFFMGNIDLWQPRIDVDRGYSTFNHLFSKIDAARQILSIISNPSLMKCLTQWQFYCCFVTLPLFCFLSIFCNNRSFLLFNSSYTLIEWWGEIYLTGSSIYTSLNVTIDLSSNLYVFSF